MRHLSSIRDTIGSAGRGGERVLRASSPVARSAMSSASPPLEGPSGSRALGPSVRDMSLYDETDGWALSDRERASRRDLVAADARFRRLRRRMRERQEKTPTAALRAHIQVTARAKTARDLHPDVIRRRAAGAEGPDAARRFAPARDDGGRTTGGGGGPSRSSDVGAEGTGGARAGAGDGDGDPGAGATRSDDRGPEGETSAGDGARGEDGMRHLPEGGLGDWTPPVSRERRLAMKVARALGRVVAPHASWEGARSTRGERRG